MLVPTISPITHLISSSVVNRPNENLTDPYASSSLIPIAINTDTHYLSNLDWTELGCAVARRAWIGPDQVLNTRSLEELLAWTRRG